MFNLAEVLVRLEKTQEMVVDKLTEAGVFKTRSEVIRAGILGLGKEYGIIGSLKEIEKELVARKLKKEASDMKRKKKAYLSEDAALSKYR